MTSVGHQLERITAGPYHHSQVVEHVHTLSITVMCVQA